MLKALDIPGATVPVASDLLISLAILSDTTVRRSEVDREDLKPRKKAMFSFVINNIIICKFYEDFSNHRKKINRAVVFSYRPLPNILNYRNNQWESKNLRNKTSSDT